MDTNTIFLLKYLLSTNIIYQNLTNMQDRTIKVKLAYKKIYLDKRKLVQTSTMLEANKANV